MQHPVIRNVLYGKHSLVQNSFSRGSRGKREAASVVLSRASETYTAGSCPRAHTENTAEDLVSHVRETERRVLALGGAATSKIGGGRTPTAM